MIGDICKVFAPSGAEDEMRKFIEEQISGLFDEIKTDNIGNLIAKSGTGNFCIECSMDSCGIMIVSSKDGKAHFAGVGGINAEYLIGKKILFADGRLGIVRYDGKTPSESKISDLYLEADTDDINVGDFGVVKSGYCETSAKMFANGLGNRIGLAAVIEALKMSPKPENLCVVFSAQKRLGARGIQAFFGANEFDKVVTVDAVPCGSGVKSGNGCALVVADKAGVSDVGFKTELCDLISEKGIRANMTVTDADLCMGHIITSGTGTACVAVGIPVSHKDKNFECVEKSDFLDAVKFLSAMIEGI